MPRAVDPDDHRVRNFPRLELDKFFLRTFREVRPGTRLLELGSGNSIWLPYFAKRFGFLVHGLDYSPDGCAQSRAALEREGVEGEVSNADLFDPPLDLIEAFDVVFSFGLLEHFDDTSLAVASFARYLRPGGLLVTLVPNMRGAVGLLQHVLNPKIFRLHVPLAPGDLDAAHESSNLAVRSVGFTQFVNFGVCNPGPRGGKLAFARVTLWTAAVGLSGVAWWAQRATSHSFRANRISSPYVYCVAHKPS
jgi:SAM-dependent methyltransferase